MCNASHAFLSHQRIHALLSLFVIGTVRCTSECAGYPRPSPQNPARYAVLLSSHIWRFRYTCPGSGKFCKGLACFCIPGIHPGWWWSNAAPDTPDRSHRHSTHHKHIPTTDARLFSSWDAYKLWRVPGRSQIFSCRSTVFCRRCPPQLSQAVCAS